MLSGKNLRPFISQDAVRRSLEALLYSPKTHPEYLLSLLVVDEFLTNPDLPTFAHSREFALEYIIISIVTAEVMNNRKVMGEGDTLPEESREKAVSAIKEDAKHHSPELLGWNWLYYRYVRVVYNFSPQEFCEYAAIDNRTLRRYQQHAIKRLTERLIELEWSVSAQKRKRRLHTELPYIGRVSLIGRAHERQKVRQYILDEPIAHIHILGAGGVGKSFLAEAVLVDMINDGQLDQIIWINNPPSSEYVWQHLGERLLPENGKYLLREYCLCYKTAVILDLGASSFDDLHDWQQLLHFLSAAIVLVLSRGHQSLSNVLTISISELGESDAKLLIRRALLRSNSHLSIEDYDYFVEKIWQRVGGNPLAIQLASAFFKGSLNEPDYQIVKLDDLFDDLFNSFSNGAKYVWGLLAILPHEKHKIDDILQISPSTVDMDSFLQLHDSYIIEFLYESVSEATCYITVSARSYIESSHAHDNILQDIVNLIISELDTGNKLTLLMVEQLLLCQWLEVPQSTRDILISRWQHAGVRRQRWATWRHLLETHTPQFLENSFDLRLNYGICLRNLGDWENARSVFDELVDKCGVLGDFQNQALVLTELATVLRYQGHYRTCADILRRVEYATSRYPNNSRLVRAFIYEQAQLAIDTSDSAGLRKIISHLPLGLRGNILLSEAHLLVGNVNMCITTAHQALEVAVEAPMVQARIHSVLGRGYEQQGRFDEAHDQFLQALGKFEQYKDIVGVPRAQTNLGALLLLMKQYDDADNLLTQAEKTQLHLGDRVGLRVTQHNLQLLRIALSQYDAIQ